jgi:hypothetical protein
MLKVFNSNLFKPIMHTLLLFNDCPLKIVFAKNLNHLCFIFEKLENFVINLIQLCNKESMHMIRLK